MVYKAWGYNHAYIPSGCQEGNGIRSSHRQNSRYAPNSLLYGEATVVVDLLVSLKDSDVVKCKDKFGCDMDKTNEVKNRWNEIMGH